MTTMTIRTDFALVLAGFILGIAGCGAEPLKAIEQQPASASSASTEACSPSAGNCPEPEPPCTPNPSAGKECPGKLAPTQCPPQLPAVTGQPCCLDAWPQPVWGTWVPVMMNGVPFQCEPNP